MAAGEDGLNELAEALSAHPSGAQLLPLLSEAASAEAAGRVRDASRYVVSIGVRLVNGGNNIADFKLAERVFTFAVTLATAWDEAAPVEVQNSSLLAGCNPHLADALNWLATAEARMGRKGEAETHHCAAFAAAAELGLLDASNRTLHALHFHRGLRMFDKHKALLRAWAVAVGHLVAKAPPAVPFIGDRPDLPSLPKLAATSNQLPTVAAFALVELGAESELDCLAAASALLFERVMYYAARGKQGKAAALAAGPLLTVAAAIEAHPLRSRPNTPGATLLATPACSVADQAAQLFQQAALKTHACRVLHLRVGLQAGTMGWKGWAPPDRDLFPPSAAQLLLTGGALALQDGWKSAHGDGGGPMPGVCAANLPKPVAKLALARLETILSDAEAWVPTFDAGKPPKCAAAAMAEPGTPLQLALGLLQLSSSLLGVSQERNAASAARVAKAAAQLCGVAGHVGNQGEALHLLGCALFHVGSSQMPQARDAFVAAAVTKEANGAAAGTTVTDGTEEGIKAVGYVETVLFLAKTHTELGAMAKAEECHKKALDCARARMGDGHSTTRKALEMFMGFKRMQKAAAEQLARLGAAAGGVKAAAKDAL